MERAEEDERRELLERQPLVEPLDDLGDDALDGSAVARGRKVEQARANVTTIGHGFALQVPLTGL